jgi:hypothetical protein
MSKRANLGACLLLNCYCRCADSEAEGAAPRSLPRKRKHAVRGQRVRVPPGSKQSLTVWCESDVFQAIGLSYVPPFMRQFHNKPW